MKILIISQQWDPEDGTPQRRWGHLTEGLVDRGHQVQVVAAPPHYPGGKLTSDDPRHAPHAVAPGNRGETVWRSSFREHSRSLTSRVRDQAVVAASSWRIASHIARKWHPDLVLTTAPPLPQAVVSSVVAKTFRIPYVIDLRDVWPDILGYMNEWGSRAEANPKDLRKAAAYDVLIRAGGWVFGRALRGATGIVTTTPSFAEKLRDHGFPRVVNVRNMASVRDNPVPSLAETDFLDGRDREAGTLRVLYTGTTGRAQGLENALEAVRLCREAGVNIQLRIIGSGSHLRRLELQAQKDRLPVALSGRVPFDEVLDQYEWCDTTLVHLRDWKPLHYTVPSKLYEALSIGRHVTVAADGESARIIEESGAGAAVPSMDAGALAALWIDLANHRERLNVGDIGRQWLLERETPEENAAKFETFVSAVAKARRSPQRQEIQQV